MVQMGVGLCQEDIHELPNISQTDTGETPMRSTKKHSVKTSVKKQGKEHVIQMEIQGRE